MTSSIEIKYLVQANLPRGIKSKILTKRTFPKLLP
jgi:hypothetical protein